MEYARQILQLDTLIVLGHSGHAFMAMAYATAYPQHVQKLVLLNTAISNSQERQQQSLSYFEAHASMERKHQFAHEIALLEQDLKKEPERRFVHMCIRMGAHSFMILCSMLPLCGITFIRIWKLLIIYGE